MHAAFRASPPLKKQATFRSCPGLINSGSGVARPGNKRAIHRVLLKLKNKPGHCTPTTSSYSRTQNPTPPRGIAQATPAGPSTVRMVHTLKARPSFGIDGEPLGSSGLTVVAALLGKGGRANRSISREWAHLRTSLKEKWTESIKTDPDTQTRQLKSLSFSLSLPYTHTHTHTHTHLKRLNLREFDKIREQ